MNYFTTIDTLRAHFASDPVVNEITQGDIFSIDLNKKTIFTLVHIMINNSTAEEFVIRYNITIMAMDIVDLSKAQDTDLFYGMDNETDALNAMHSVLIRAYKLMKAGSLWDDKVVIEEYRLRLGVVEVLIGMVIWPISFIIFLRSIFK